MTKKETSTLHIDTSLQIERCKATRRSQVVEQEIRQFRFLSTSTYAKLEFKRAWLQRLAYLYSLSGTVATTAELIGRVNERLSSHPLHQRQLSTCLEVIEAFLERSPGKLTDAARLVRMRAHLRNAVLVAYDWWESNVTHEYNGTDCARASERPRLAAGDRIDVSIPKCRRTNINCRLLGFLQENAQHLLAVKNQIDRPGSNASVELREARKVLEDFERNPEFVCEDGTCAKLGDIIIAVDGVNTGSFAANNDKEWTVLATALGKHLINPVRRQTSG